MDLTGHSLLPPSVTEAHKWQCGCSVHVPHHRPASADFPRSHITCVGEPLAARSAPHGPPARLPSGTGLKAQEVGSATTGTGQGHSTSWQTVCDPLLFVPRNEQQDREAEGEELQGREETKLQTMGKRSRISWSARLWGDPGLFTQKPAFNRFKVGSGESKLPWGPWSTGRAYSSEQRAAGVRREC